MSMLIGLCLLLTLTSWPLTSADDVCAQNSDGCTIPLDLTYFYEKLFTPSCYKHDQCYNCGKMYGFSRLDCDKEFLSLMKSACKTLKRRRSSETFLTSQVAQRLFASGVDKRFLISEEDFCKAIAYNWYGVIRLGGSSYYENPSKDFCSESWVQSCLP